MGELGIGNWELGIGHGAWGIGLRLRSARTVGAGSGTRAMPQRAGYANDSVSARTARRQAMPQRAGYANDRLSPNGDRGDRLGTRLCPRGQTAPTTP